MIGDTEVFLYGHSNPSGICHLLYTSYILQDCKLNPIAYRTYKNVIAMTLLPRESTWRSHNALVEKIQVAHSSIGICHLRSKL
jgi:hypothetical protein